MVSEAAIVEEYLAEASLGRYSPEKIKNVNGKIRTYGLLVHGAGVIALAGMAVNSYFNGDYGMTGVSALGEIFFVPATYLFEYATRSKK